MCRGIYIETGLQVSRPTLRPTLGFICTAMRHHEAEKLRFFFSCPPNPGTCGSNPQTTICLFPCNWRELKCDVIMLLFRVLVRREAARPGTRPEQADPWAPPGRICRGTLFCFTTTPTNRHTKSVPAGRNQSEIQERTCQLQWPGRPHHRCMKIARAIRAGLGPHWEDPLWRAEA